MPMSMLDETDAKSARAHESVVDVAVAKIRDRIYRGSYVPGQRLVEPDLVAHLGVSRTALREAFRRLAAEGLLELELYRGASVRRVSRADALEAMTIRECLEGLSARLATAGAASPEARKRLLACRKAMVAAAGSTGSPNAYAAENVKFHALVAELGDNSTLARLIEQVQMPLVRIIYSRLLDHEARENSLAQHLDIIEAMLNGDPDAAEAAMRRHVRQSVQAMLQLDDEYFA